LVEAQSPSGSLKILNDLHAYPGQAEVRSGSYSKLLASYKNHIPSDKQIILGEVF